ncbi:MAG: AraC family transcriptional regulator [Bacteroidetes bacterium]|nr:AraC family transcriptional regulator [Bacteroidota bacterium]
MEKIEKIEVFNKAKSGLIPEGINQDAGHFNVFRLEPFVGDRAKPVPYRRRDYFKITLMVGQGRIKYADKVIEVDKQALVFSNPLIPYEWEHTETIRHGFFCVFDQFFFHQFGTLTQYEVFQPNGTHVFDLSDEQVTRVSALYERMLEEINSDYIHKYDVLRTLVFELLHFAMKMQPSMSWDKQQVNASKRITTMFLELLERQFPIDENHRKIQLRSASEYASQLNVHVNHLNRAVKETTGRTTSQLIAERILQESKILLKQSGSNVSEISYSLGFNEVTHFNNFFKKHVQLSPLKFRNV